MVFASGFGFFIFFLLDLREFMILFVTNLSRTSLLNENTIRDEGSTELYAAHTVDTVDMVYTVDTIGMVYTGLPLSLVMFRWEL